MLNAFNRSLIMNLVSGMVGCKFTGKMEGPEPSAEQVVKIALANIITSVQLLGPMEDLGMVMEGAKEALTACVTNLEENTEEAIEFVNRMYAICYEGEITKTLGEG